MKDHPPIQWHLAPIDDFDRHASEWDRLAMAVPSAPFLESRFMRPLLATFGGGKEKLACALCGDEIAALTILAPDGFGRWNTFQPSQLPTGPLLLAEGVSIESALAALGAALPPTWLALGLTEIDSRLQPPPAAGPRLDVSPYIQTAWVDVEGSFEAYWEGRGKNLRQNIRKQRRKLLEESISARLEILTGTADVPAAIADYGALESSGWKSGGGTAIHPDNEQGRFYRMMMENFCSVGRGRIFKYRFNDKLVAIDLCVESADTLVILKTTYDESIKAYSPAFLMREEAFQTIWAEGRMRRIEFFGKVMEWHKRWTDNARELYHLTYFRWNWLKTMRDRTRKPASAETPTTPND